MKILLDIKENKVEVPFNIASRRAGDLATCYADVSKAKRELGWEQNILLKIW